MKRAPQFLSEYRETKKLSQTEAAQLVGVRQNTWSDWEKDRKEPRVRTALLLHELGIAPIFSWAANDTQAKRKR